MNRPVRSIASVALPFVLAACGAIQGTDVSVAFLQTETKGAIALGPSSGSASLPDLKNDLEDSLGVDGPSESLLLGATVQTTIGRFGASTFWFDDEGTGTLQEDFGDIPQGSSVDSEFDFLNVKTYWVYDVLKGRNYRLAPGIAVDFIDAETKVRSRSAAQTYEEVEMFAPVPLLFLDGEVTFGRFSLAAQGGGLRVNLSDGDGIYWDVDARAGFAVTKDVEVFGGYRYLSMHSIGLAKERDADLDIFVHGWFVGGELHF